MYNMLAVAVVVAMCSVGQALTTPKYKYPIYPKPEIERYPNGRVKPDSMPAPFSLKWAHLIAKAVYSDDMLKRVGAELKNTTKIEQDPYFPSQNFQVDPDPGWSYHTKLGSVDEKNKFNLLVTYTDVNGNMDHTCFVTVTVDFSHYLLGLGVTAKLNPKQRKYPFDMTVCYCDCKWQEDCMDSVNCSDPKHMPVCVEHCSYKG